MALLGPLRLRHVSVGVANLGSLPRVFGDDIRINPWLSLFLEAGSWGRGCGGCAAEAKLENLLSGQVSSRSCDFPKSQWQRAK